MSKLEHYKARTAHAIARNRESARMTVNAAEIVIGAGLGGFVVEKYPDIAGIPTDAGAGIALVAAGMAMKQRDMTALGLGMLAGYAHDKGAEMARG